MTRRQAERPQEDAVWNLSPGARMPRLGPRKHHVHASVAQQLAVHQRRQLEHGGERLPVDLPAGRHLREEIGEGVFVVEDVLALDRDRFRPRVELRSRV
jgi:hypothetical protein